MSKLVVTTIEDASGASGTVTFTGSVQAVDFNSTSDARLKTEVTNIKIIGTILMNIKKRSFLSFNLNLGLSFLVSRNIKKKKGISIPICLNKKISGYLIWSKYTESSKPVLFNP